MADEADIANERVEEILEAARSVRKPVGPVANGRCHNCQEPLPLGERWCDKDCFDDWEKRTSLQARQFADGLPKPVLDDIYEVDDDDYAESDETF